MRHFASLGAALLLVGAAQASPAQSDILLRLRSGSPLGDRFRIDSAGGFVATTQLGIGIIPATGAGYRFMYYPFKAALRFGHANSTEWDDSNTGFYSFAGGESSIASAFGTFAFGDQVKVTGVDGAGFGGSNEVGGTAGFTAGASNNVCGFGSVAIGFTNTTGTIDGSGNCVAGNGQGSVAIGYRVTADADYAVALGHRASANGHDGAFVSADQSTTDSLQASANNQFSARYAGGYRLFTNATMTVGVAVNAGASSWNAISDRNRKQDFDAVDGADVLSRLRGLPVTTWRYRDEVDRTVLHIGPMAQDWQRAFGFSHDSTTINMSDFDGVNLAAIKALDAEVVQLRGANTTQTERIRALEAENAALRARLDRIEARLSTLP